MSQYDRLAPSSLIDIVLAASRLPVPCPIGHVICILILNLQNLSSIRRLLDLDPGWLEVRGPHHSIVPLLLAIVRHAIESLLDHPISILICLVAVPFEILLRSLRYFHILLVESDFWVFEHLGPVLIIKSLVVELVVCLPQFWQVRPQIFQTLVGIRSAL